MAQADFTDRERFFMRLALEQAVNAVNDYEVPVGCVFVWRNRIVAKGYNQTNITRNVRNSLALVLCICK
jgi:tRNA(Arg) A34 adenosine deaminase TadA